MNLDCPLCLRMGRTFVLTSRADLKAHLHIDHFDHLPYECRLCRRRFATKHIGVDHIQQIHGGGGNEIQLQLLFDCYAKHVAIKIEVTTLLAEAAERVRVRNQYTIDDPTLMNAFSQPIAASQSIVDASVQQSTTAARHRIASCDSMSTSSINDQQQQSLCNESNRIAAGGNRSTTNRKRSRQSTITCTCGHVTSNRSDRMYAHISESHSTMSPYGCITCPTVSAGSIIDDWQRHVDEVHDGNWSSIVDKQPDTMMYVL